MKTIFPRLLVFIFATGFTACNSGDRIEGYKSHEILVVTLDIEDNLTIEKITLLSSYEQFTDSILGKNIGNKSTIKLRCPQKGEGTFSICVITNQDTLCSKDNYIEGGYRPRLKLKNNKFETLEWN